MILEIKRNGEQLHVFNVKEDDVVLGRGAESDCPINAEDISRLHCRIKFKDGKYYIQDLKSSNGTFVYDERIAPGDFHEFLPEFPIKIGKSVQIFIHENEPPQDIGGYDAPIPAKVDSSAKTQIFTGMIKKDALKPKRDSAKKNMNVMLIIPVVLAGIAAFYFLGMRRPAPVVEAPKQVTPVEVVDPNATNMPKEGCTYDDEKELCQSLELAQGDYVQMSPSEINVVVNWQRLLDNKTAQVTTLPEGKRERFIAILMIHKLRSLPAGIAPDLKTIVLYGTSTDYKILKKKLTVTMENFPAYSEQDMVILPMLTSGSVDEFETKYGSFYKLESF